MLEYVNMCGQCVIGVVKKNVTQNRNASSQSSKMNDEVYVENFDIMQDNSCQIDLDQNHSVQKPKQVVSLNSKGKLGYHFVTQQKSNKTEPNPFGQGVIKQGNFAQDHLTDIDLPHEQSKNIKAAIKELGREQRNLDNQFEERTRQLKEYLKTSSSDDTAIGKQEQMKKDDEIRKKLENAVQATLLRMSEKVFDVKQEFFKMIKMTINTYTAKNPQTNLDLMPEFRGSGSGSGHIVQFFKWHQKREIFDLIDRNGFKNHARSPDNQLLNKQQFYKRFIQQQILQNFVAEKYFPCDIDGQLKQFLALPLVSVSRKQYDNQNSRPSPIGNGQQNAASVNLFGNTPVLINNSNKGVRDSNLSTSLSERASSLLSSSIKYFPRNFDQEVLREDMIRNYSKKPPDFLQNSDRRLANFFQEVGVEASMSQIKDMKYRITHYFDQKSLKRMVNIIVSWLLLFLGSLEYQLNPFAGNQKHIIYKSIAYYDSQIKLEQMLAKNFERVIKLLIYKCEYQFNLKCPLLSLLFQQTHKYNYLHQKLINIVLQDIDQQQNGGRNGTKQNISNQFVIYQLHWENKQLQLNHHEAKELKEQIRVREIQQKLVRFLNKKLEELNPKEESKEYHQQNNQNQELEDVKYRLKKLKSIENYSTASNTPQDNPTAIVKSVCVEYKIDIRNLDPYVLNDKVDVEWQFNQDRLQLLRKLATEDQQENYGNQIGRELEKDSFKRYEERIESMHAKGNHQHDSKRRNTNFLSKAKDSVTRLISSGHNKRHASKQGDTEARIQSELGLSEQDVAKFKDKKFRRQISKYMNWQEEKDQEGPRSSLAPEPESNYIQQRSLYQQANGFTQHKEGKDILPSQLDEQIYKARSFINKRQIDKIKRSKRQNLECGLQPMEAGLLNAMDQQRNDTSESRTENDDLSPQLSLDLINVRCTTPGCNNNRISMKAILKNFSCEKCRKKQVVQARIQVKLISRTRNELRSELYSFELICPKSMRQRLEELLCIDKQYKTLQQIDISIFQQATQMQELYWNCVFWFKYAKLPYLWMAPYSSNDLNTSAPNYQDLDGMAYEAARSDFDSRGSMPANSNLLLKAGTEAERQLRTTMPCDMAFENDSDKNDHERKYKIASKGHGIGNMNRNAQMMNKRLPGLRSDPSISESDKTLKAKELRKERKLQRQGERDAGKRIGAIEQIDTETTVASMTQQI